jgi:type VI secretion system protein ImpB
LRSRMTDLRGNLQGNDKLEELLRTTVGDKDKMAQLRKEMGMPEESHE